MTLRGRLATLFPSIHLGLIAFGELIEILQSLLTYRNAEWLDLVGDIAGIGAGLAIGWLGAGGWSLRVEQWLTR